MHVKRWALGAAMVLALSTFGKPNFAMADTVKINASALQAIGKVDPRFQSYNVEMAEIIGGKFWKPYAHMQASHTRKGPPNVGEDRDLFEARPPVDLSNPRLRMLAAALGPTYVRVSGTWANTVYFQDNDDPPPAEPPKGYRGVLTRKEWKGVVDFAKAVDAKLVTSFTINGAVRDASGTWTPREAKPLVEYTRAIGGDIYAAELFNEPNLPSFGGAPKGYDASQFARDEAVFRHFLEHASPDTKIAGPGDVVTANLSLPGGISAKDLLTAKPEPKFNIISYHFYGAVSQRCGPPSSPAGTSPGQALTEAWLARTDKAFQTHKALRDRYAPAAPIWITETAGAACGGTPWDATFLDTFRYLDQLGRLAKQGADAVFHNTLSAGDYALIDGNTLKPRPSYWAALLWHRFMGTTVLDAGPIQKELHIYAQCLRDQPGGVSLLAINLGKSTAAIELSTAAEMYTLTAPKLRSATVQLNGRTLSIGKNNRIPAMRPRRVMGHRAALPPTSISFIALPGAKNPHCP